MATHGWGDIIFSLKCILADSFVFLTFETEFVLFLAVLENFVLPMG